MSNAAIGLSRVSPEEEVTWILGCCPLAMSRNGFTPLLPNTRRSSHTLIILAMEARICSHMPLDEHITLGRVICTSGVEIRNHVCLFISMFHEVVHGRLQLVVEFGHKLWPFSARVLEYVVGQVQHGKLLAHVFLLGKLCLPSCHNLLGILRGAADWLSLLDFGCLTQAQCGQYDSLQPICEQGVLAPGAPF